jgi:hypothetical protein
MRQNRSGKCDLAECHPSECGGAIFQALTSDMSFDEFFFVTQCRADAK